MLRLVSGAALLLLSVFMLYGFLRSTSPHAALETLFALVIAVALPAAGGLVLIASHYRSGKRVVQRREQLRDQTIESEVLRLAAQRDGRLTLVEVVTEMALPSEVAQGALDSLVMREIADIAVTDSGVLVYTFRDLQRLGEKASAKGILE